MRVVAGLGNPGSRYRNTRHNMGFIVVDSFVRRHELGWRQKRCEGWLARGVVFGQDVVVVKPSTYMNRSGRSIGALMALLSAGPGDLLVVHDDIDLPFGRIRIRPGGSSGGHKGVESIIESVGSREFLRLRVGIGRPAAGEIEEYVLEPFSAEETAALPEVVDRAVAALECILSQGTAEAMNRFNARSRKAAAPAVGVS